MIQNPNAKPIIILTGATGFIGSFITEKALKDGFQLIALTRANSNSKWLKQQNCHVETVDFSNVDELKNIFAKLLSRHGQIDYVIHNAGITKTNKVGEFELVNYTYTKNLIDALVGANINLKKFVLVSSLAALGPGNEKTLAPITSASAPSPNTAYGKSKLLAEKYLQTFTNLNWLIIRPTGVYGPKEKDYFLMLRTVQKGLAPKIGFRDQYLTFVYVTDLVDVILQSLKSPYSQKSYLVTDGNTYTADFYRDLCKRLLNKKAFKLTIPLGFVGFLSSLLETTCGIFNSTPTLNRDKFLTLRAKNWKCDISDTIKDLNYKPKLDLETGLKESIAWFKREKWLH